MFFAVVSLSNHDLPFNDTLDWTKFSAVVSSKKDYFTATGIEGENFTKLRDNLKKVKSYSDFFPIDKHYALLSLSDLF